MRHDEFIGQVQERAHLASQSEAERASRATLETLGERIPRGLADNLGAELPPEIAEYLCRQEVFRGFGTGEPFDLNTFTNRVGKRAGLDDANATDLARAVLEVLAEAGQGKALDKVRASLPRDIRKLIDAGVSR